MKKEMGKGVGKREGRRANRTEKGRGRDGEPGRVPLGRATWAPCTHRALSAGLPGRAGVREGQQCRGRA